MGLAFISSLNLSGNNLLLHIAKSRISIHLSLLAAHLTLLLPNGLGGDSSSENAAPEIQPVWEWSLNNASESPLPILKADSINHVDDESWDGSAGMDSYGGLVRYNDSWLLLAIRENGVDETSDEFNSAIADAYPDRSLIWINHETGEPNGVALHIGIVPVALDSDFLEAGGSSLDYYFTFDVTDYGSILVGYKNMILEYEVVAPVTSTPDLPEFGVPKIIYRQPDDGSPFWPEWRWASIQSQGSRSDLKIIATGKTWRPGMGPIYIETSNGETFTASWSLENGFEAASGGVSLPYLGMLDGQRIGQWVFATTYPGANDGLSETSVLRYLLTTSFGGGWELLETTAIELTGIPSNENQPAYQPQFLTEVALPETLQGISNWIVTYSTPSYNSSLLDLESPTPGWLALHPRDGGAALATHLIPVNESMELIPAEDHPAALFHSTHGTLRTSIPPRAKPDTFEILWSSGIYGYGRYLVGELEPPIVAPEIFGIGFNQRGIIVYWDPEVGGRFQLQRTISLSDPDWQNVGVPTISNRVIDRDPLQSAAFYRVLLVE